MVGREVIPPVLCITLSLVTVLKDELPAVIRAVALLLVPADGQLFVGRCQHKVRQLMQERGVIALRIDEALERRIWTQLGAGKGILKVARELGVGTGTVQRVKAEMAGPFVEAA